MDESQSPDFDVISRRKYDAVSKSIRRSIKFDGISTQAKAPKFFGELLLQSSLQASIQLNSPRTTPPSPSSGAASQNLNYTEKYGNSTTRYDKPIPNISSVVVRADRHRRKSSKSNGNIIPQDAFYLSSSSSSSSSSSLSSSSSVSSSGRRRVSKTRQKSFNESNNLHLSSDESIGSDSDYSGQIMPVKNRSQLTRTLSGNQAHSTAQSSVFKSSESTPEHVISDSRFTTTKNNNSKQFQFTQENNNSKQYVPIQYSQESDSDLQYSEDEYFQSNDVYTTISGCSGSGNIGRGPGCGGKHIERIRSSHRTKHLAKVVGDDNVITAYSNRQVDIKYNDTHDSTNKQQSTRERYYTLGNTQRDSATTKRFQEKENNVILDDANIVVYMGEIGNMDNNSKGQIYTSTRSEASLYSNGNYDDTSPRSAGTSQIQQHSAKTSTYDRDARVHWSDAGGDARVHFNSPKENIGLTLTSEKQQDKRFNRDSTVAPLLAAPVRLIQAEKEAEEAKQLRLVQYDNGNSFAPVMHHQPFTASLLSPPPQQLQYHHHQQLQQQQKQQHQQQQHHEVKADSGSRFNLDLPPPQSVEMEFVLKNGSFEKRFLSNKSTGGVASHFNTKDYDVNRVEKDDRDYDENKVDGPYVTPKGEKGNGATSILIPDDMTTAKNDEVQNQNGKKSYSKLHAAWKFTKQLTKVNKKQPKKDLKDNDSTTDTISVARGGSADTGSSRGSVWGALKSRVAMVNDARTARQNETAAQEAEYWALVAREKEREEARLIKLAKIGKGGSNAKKLAKSGSPLSSENERPHTMSRSVWKGLSSVVGSIKRVGKSTVSAKEFKESLSPKSASSISTSSPRSSLASKSTFKSPSLTSSPKSQSSISQSMSSPKSQSSVSQTMMTFANFKKK